MNNNELEKLEALKLLLLERVRKEKGQRINWNDIIGQGKDLSVSIYELMKNNENVLNKIKLVYYNGADIAVNKLQHKIPPNSRLKTKLNEARLGKGVPMDDKTYDLYYTFIHSFNTKQQKEYEFNGYYWSYIRNSISNVPFQLKITYPIFSKNNSKAIVSASIENFHDRTLPEHYSGFGYFGGEMNNLFIELHSQTESTFKDAVYLILSVGGNLEEMDKNLIRGILTGVSASEGSRPILSMEVILLNKNADNYLISKAKTYLHLHKYSIRVRSANLNDKFPVLSGKLDVSNFTKKIKDEFKNYTYYHFDLNKEVVCGTIKFDYAQHQLCTITNYCYDIVLNPSVNECHYRFDINQGNTDLIINDYSSRRDRELRMEIRIRWSPRRNKSKIMSGTCIMYENDIFFPSPIILYPTNSNNIIRKKLSFEEFLNEIKSLHGEEEHQRLLKSLKLIYNKEILSILHLDET